MKAKILISDESIVNNGAYGRKFTVAEEIDVPKELLKYLVGENDKEVSITFDYEGMGYTHTLRRHVLDKMNDDDNRETIELLRKREDINNRLVTLLGKKND